MKTSEFIKKVKELGYRFNGVNSIFILNDKDEVLVWLSTKQMYVVSTDYSSFGRLKDDEKKELLNLILKYIETPIEEREGPKKYYLRLPDFIAERYSYLNCIGNDYMNVTEYKFDSNTHMSPFKTQFTQEEIDNLPNQDFIQSLIKEEV